MRLTHQSHTSNIINSILDIYAIDSPIPITYVELGLLTIAVLPDGEHVILLHHVYSYNFASASQVRGLSYSNITLWAVAGMGTYSNHSNATYATAAVLSTRMHTSKAQQGSSYAYSAASRARLLTLFWSPAGVPLSGCVLVVASPRTRTLLERRCLPA